MDPPVPVETMELVDHGELPQQPFRVTNPDGCQFFIDDSLTKPSMEIAATFDSILSATYLTNKVVFVGEPYYCYTHASNVSPIDDGNNELQLQSNTVSSAPAAFSVDISIDDQNYNINTITDVTHFVPPQLDTKFNNNQPREMSETIPSIPSHGATPVINEHKHSTPTRLIHPNKGLNDSQGIEKHIKLSQNDNLVSMLHFGNGRPSSRQNSRPNSNSRSRPGSASMAGGGDIIINSDNNNNTSHNQNGNDRFGNKYQHVSSHSRTMFPSHQSNTSQSNISNISNDIFKTSRHSTPRSVASNHSQRSQLPQSTDQNDSIGNNELFEDAGSHYGSEVSIGSFVPLPRQRTVADGLKMGYTKGIGTSIPASQIKSPLIYNQICNEILIKKNKDRGEKMIKDNIIISKFNDARPQLEVEYFKMSKGVRGGLVVVIPFFNEPASELEATLRYLHGTYTWMCETDPAWQNRPMDICMIQDGWFKADGSMQRYLKKMFPKQYYINPNANETAESKDEKGDNNNKDESVSGHSVNLDDLEDKGDELLPSVSKYWWEYLPEFIDYDKKRDGPVTYVFEKTHDNPSFFELKFEQNDLGKIDKRMEIQKRFRITLIVKIDNRRKHNSHEWFLGENGFSDAYNAKYLFATDAFTLFQPSCMYHMVHYLDTHPDTAAVTGRQRAMNRKQQDKDGKEFALSLAYVLRMTQTFDFELTSGVFNPVYGVCGFLPVIPGPCGLYRCSDVGQNLARYWYFDIVNAEPTETGLVLGNLRIAEDRILTYASILKVKDYRRMAFVPQGLFFFETETDLDKFIFQRRRWINGTFAGFIYILISAPYHIWGWHANFWIKFKVWLLLVINFAQLSTVVLSPAISFSILDTSLSYMLSKFVESHETLHDNIMLAGWSIWCLHIIIHNKAKFSHIIVKLLYGWSLLISLSLIITYFILFVIEQQNVYEALLEDQMKESELDFVLGLMAFGTIVPFSCQYMVGGWEAVIILLKSTVHYFLSFHLMIPWFTSYAFARCWDLTWGNRPAEGEMDEVEEEKFQAAEIMKSKFLQYSRLVSLLMIVCNISLALLPKYYIILIMSGFLMATAFFMGTSFFVLLTQSFCGEWLTNCLSRSLVEYRKAAEREKEEEKLYGGQIESIGHYNFKHSTNNNNDDNKNNEYSSDEDYVVIPNNYQPRVDVSQQNMSDNEDDDDYYDEYTQSGIDNHGSSTQKVQNVQNQDYANDQYDAQGMVENNNMEEKNMYDYEYEYEYNEEQYQGYYDENGNWIDATANDTHGGYYDENGNWVNQNGNYYDENGNYVEDDANMDDQMSEYVPQTLMGYNSATK